MISFKLLLLLALVGVAFSDEKSVEEQEEEKSIETRSKRSVKYVVQKDSIRARFAKTEARLKKLEHRLYLLKGPNGAKGNPGKDGKHDSPGPNGGGVSYVRWGKTACPSGASLVYKGRIGGEHYTHKGGGVNYLCMTEQPRYLNHLNGWQFSGRLYGTEYQVSSYAYGRILFGKTLNDHDAPCAVCHVTTRSSKLMIPGTYLCPAGWKREYYGYLMTQYYGYAPRDFICVDRKAQDVPGSHQNHNGALLYPVESTCGSLPCHPYKNAWELTCAVCTK